MTPTPVIPAASQLDADLSSAEQALARARAATEAAGEGAIAFSRVTVYVTSKEAVDALALAWGARPYWTPGRTSYVAASGDGAAETEAAWTPGRESRAAA